MEEFCGEHFEGNQVLQANNVNIVCLEHLIAFKVIHTVDNIPVHFMGHI